MLTLNTNKMEKLGGLCQESIHSGQFMVSHFEAEAQEDEDDNEIKMPDPDDPNFQKPEDLNLCTEIQLYVPHKVHHSGGSTTITSHLEIETSLTKLFKCMNLAYRQKLTSPKWNHFKGVRLRWKDKIRLNNVIWRCWHMQFILKKKTPVCQFASPLDVDIHSNPQSVVLEGKYWKRQLSVIKAEYRKWRRNSKTKAIGYNFDTKSEFDFLDWSPLSSDRNDSNLMITEDWTSETLFSAINVPFPFPDPREIARGACIADFIQPSLGPLQPNLDDIDITFQELLQSTRLPPVPEEGTDDILKNVDCFPAIMGSEQLNTVSIMDVTNPTQTGIVSSMEDETMVDLNTPINTLQYGDDKMCTENMEIVQQATSSILRNSNNIDNVTTTQNLSQSSNLNMIGGYSATAETIAMNNAVAAAAAAASSINSFQIQTDLQNNINLSSSQLNNPTIGKNNILKGRISKPFNRSFKKREPHNYDKAQPTLHQTNIYQQMLAEQQQQTQKPQHNQQLQQQQQNMQFGNASAITTPQFPTSNTTNPPPPDIFPIQTTVVNNTLNLPIINTTMKSYSLPQQQLSSQNSTLLSQQQRSLSASSEALTTLLNIDNTSVQDLYKTNTNSQAVTATAVIAAAYKNYTNAQNMKKLTSTSPTSSMANSAAYMVDLLSSSAIRQQQQQQQQQQQSRIVSRSSSTFLIDNSGSGQYQELPTKEMFRSNSLPLNTKLQVKDEMFVIPINKLHTKTNRSRTRSTSTHQPSLCMPSATISSAASFPNIQPTALQTATSEPLLNSTLAQLLTTSNTIKQCSQSDLTQNTLRMPFISGQSNLASTYQQQQRQQQQVQHLSPQTQSVQQSQSAQQQQGLISSSQLSLSPTRSSSLPQPATLHSPPTTTKMMSFPPCLSPDSYVDDSPLSPTKAGNLSNLKYMKDSQRRVGHIHAEQKRRYNIKNGFDMLHSLIPQLQQNPNAKLSKAAMLQKGAEYIKQLRIERNIISEKMDALRKERDNLNASLSHLHSILPANGAPVSRQRTERVKQLYNAYVRYRTMQNWKFWILGLILEPLLNSYTSTVSVASVEELYRTALLWVDQHCSLVELRPAVSNKLRYLSMTTDILSDPPSTLQEEVLKAINNADNQHPNLNGT